MEETPYVDDLAISAKNNESIDVVITFTEEVTPGVVTPVDFTGRSFRAQARKAKSPTADLICDITVSIFGPATNGQLRFTVSDDVVDGLSPVKGHYDVLTREGTGPIDNLFMAPFIIEGGVTKWA